MVSNRSEPCAAGLPGCRYAVYLIPSGPWSILGQRWLGRDAASGERILRPPEDDAIIEAWTRGPRVYGLHATLKPPFHLAQNTTFGELDESLRRLAQAMSPFEIPLQLTQLRGFLAWCVAGEMPAALTRLSNACVADLDGFRRPPSSEETARRLRAELTPSQMKNLQRWGYPYVFDTFVFHVTLTDRLDEPGIAAAQSALTRIAQDEEAQALQSGSTMPVSDIGLFVQAAPGLPFVIARRYGFDGGVHDGHSFADKSAQEAQ